MANLENFKLLRKKTANRRPGKINLDYIWFGSKNPISCGTPACVMGLALALAYPKAKRLRDLLEELSSTQVLVASNIARQWLEIDLREYDELTVVLNRHGHNQLFDVSRNPEGNQRQEALDRLDICIEHLEAKQNEQ